MSTPRMSRVLMRTFYTGGNDVRLLRGGDALFPAMAQAIANARHEVLLASYIYTDEGTVCAVTAALVAAAQRGVQVKVVLDGFGCHTDLPVLRQRLGAAGVMLTVFRPLDRWWSWLQPSQLRRLHQKLCVVDSEVAFVGGINLLDDRLDHVHGWGEAARLDFAVQLRGPAVAAVAQATRALWGRAQLGGHFGTELARLTSSAKPVARARRLLRRLRLPVGVAAHGADGGLAPMRVAFVLRDNLRRRRTIERNYIDAIRRARHCVDIVTPYFYPGGAFQRALCHAAQRGVAVRLLLQGKVDYRIAALAAHALYDELLSHGVRIFEYTPAYLHAKAARVDDAWATVGSSNIDPLSLLLNLEANVIVRDAVFTQDLVAQFDQAVAVSHEITLDQPAHPQGLRSTLRRTWVAWVARLYLRVAGAVGRY